MSLPWGSHDNRLKSMTLYTICLVGALALLTYLAYPDGLEGSEFRSNKGGTDAGRRVGSSPSAGSGRGAAGKRIDTRHKTYILHKPPATRRILIQTPQVRERVVPEGVKVYRKRTVRGRQTPLTQPTVKKLARQRVPYLSELALDIDPTIRELARRRPVAATATYKNALAAAERTKDPAKEGNASTNLGHVFYLTGRFPQAVTNYSKALQINTKMGDSTEHAVSLRNLGAVLTAAGNFQEAEQYNREALRLFQSIGSEKGRLTTLNNLGVLEKNRARYSEALDWYEMALDTGPQSDSLKGLLRRNMGNFFRLWGEYEKAVQNYERSAAMYDSLGDRKQAGEVLLDACQTYAQWGRDESALKSAKKALQNFAKVGAPTDWSKKLMGDILMDTGRLDEAEPYIKEADYGSSLGRLSLLRSQPEAAKRRFEQLLQAARDEGNIDEQFVAHTGLGRASEAMKNYQLAESHYSKGVEIAEEIRSKLLVSERKNFFAAKISGFLRSEPAKGLVRIGVKQKRPERSIYPSEVIRAREFADNLSQKAEGRFFNVPRELIEQESELTNKLASLKTALPIVPKALDSQRYAELIDQIRKAENERQRFVKVLCQRYGDYCAAKHPTPVRLEQADIGPDEHILLFNCLGDGVAIQLLKGKKIAKSSFLEWNSQEMEREIRRFREPFEQIQLSKFRLDLARSFNERLTADVLQSVPTGAPITVIPDGALALLPFEALITGGVAGWTSGPYGDFPQGISYLGDRNPIIYSQSLTAMTLVRKLAKAEQTDGAVLVMADPIFEMTDERVRNSESSKPGAENKDHPSRVKSAIEQSSLGDLKLRRLPQTNELGDRLKGLYGDSCEVFTGFQCTKKEFLDRVSQGPDRYGSIVFGTHGFAANDLPGVMEPVLALSMVPKGTDGFLTTTEIAGLKMNADVVALTACKTGLGARLEGEGIMSMGRSFQCAGARSVIMSLWSVAEEPSILLVDEFFKGLRQGLSKNQAWMDSRAALRKKGFKHPFFWASFILVGEKD